MYFIASSFWEWSPIRRTGSDEIDSSAPNIADGSLLGMRISRFGQAGDAGDDRVDGQISYWRDLARAQTPALRTLTRCRRGIRPVPRTRRRASAGDPDFRPSMRFPDRRGRGDRLV